MNVRVLGETGIAEIFSSYYVNYYNLCKEKFVLIDGDVSYIHMNFHLQKITIENMKISIYS